MVKSVGQSVLRREDDYLLRGEGQYIDDIPEPKGVLYLGFVMSSQAHALIRSIDFADALRLPGVHAVLTGEDVAGLVKAMHTEIKLPGYICADRDAIARRKVRFVGEHVAAVLATNKYALHDALELVHVEYDLLDASPNLVRATEPGAPLVHDNVPNNIIFQGQFATPGFDQVHASGEFRLRERFRHGRVAAVPMEPRGCMAVPERGDSILFYSSTQIPHLVRTGLANHLGIPESNIRVIVPEVGGGFGMKAQFYPEELITAALCLKYRRAVKWIQDRREELLTNTHARDNLYDAEIAFTGEGIVTSLKLDLMANAGAYSSYPFGSTMEATGGARMILGPYRIRNYAYKTSAVVTHSCPSGVYRGVGQPACFMAIEGLMDRIGRLLGIDPAEVRSRNLIKPHEMPWTNTMGVRYDTGNYELCLAMAIEKSGYDSFRKTQPADRLVDGKYRGIGICNLTESTGGGALGWRARGLTQLSGIDSATIRVEPTGKISVYVSHASAGQGHLTAFAQVAADYLGANLADVKIIQGDTSVSPYGSNTFSSRAAVTGGGAIIRAAEKVSEKMRRIAAGILDADIQDVVLHDGVASLISRPDQQVAFQAIAETAYSLGTLSLAKSEAFGLEASEYYDPPTSTIANAVHIVQVAVDAQDGRVSIENYSIVHDCGRVINPMIVDGQIHGAVAQGLGEALMEEMVYDDHGQLLNASLLDYLLPTALDVPDMAMWHVESPSIDALGGFKGVGEAGVIGAVPALTNAVADALAGIGANVNSVPMRPSYLLSLIRSANAARGAGITPT
jgi:carbon-monoxide dehydrogenase large subunit